MIDELTKELMLKAFIAGHAKARCGSLDKRTADEKFESWFRTVKIPTNVINLTSNQHVAVSHKGFIYTPSQDPRKKHGPKLFDHQAYYDQQGIVNDDNQSHQ